MQWLETLPFSGGVRRICLSGFQAPPPPFQPLTRCRQLPSLCKSTSLLQTELFPNITLGYHYYDYDVYDFDTHYPMYWPTKPGMVETSLACA